MNPKNNLLPWFFISIFLGYASWSYADQPSQTQEEHSFLNGVRDELSDMGTVTVIMTTKMMTFI